CGIAREDTAPQAQSRCQGSGDRASRVRLANPSVKALRSASVRTALMIRTQAGRISCSRDEDSRALRRARSAELPSSLRPKHRRKARHPRRRPVSHERSCRRRTARRRAIRRCSVEATIEPGVTVARHTHPGIESAYVIEGGFELPIQGQAPRMIKKGDGFHIPPETPHAGGKPGDAKSVILITYVVEKGKPLASPA